MVIKSSEIVGSGEDIVQDIKLYFRILPLPWNTLIVYNISSWLAYLYIQWIIVKYPKYPFFPCSKKMYCARQDSQTENNCFLKACSYDIREAAKKTETDFGNFFSGRLHIGIFWGKIETKLLHFPCLSHSLWLDYLILNTYINKVSTSLTFNTSHKIILTRLPGQSTSLPSPASTLYSYCNTHLPPPNVGRVQIHRLLTFHDFEIKGGTFMNK